MRQVFKFKKFQLLQDKTAMKVGTDGVLLGAWVSLNSNPYSILDVGAGTGLISLMMAQRSSAEILDAVEINDSAYEQAVENFENSDWSDRLFCYHASIQEVANDPEDVYDLIVSNPPFYTSTYKELNPDRAQARHAEDLSFETLLFCTSKLLSPKGQCAFIIPYEEEDDFIKIAHNFELFPNRLSRVSGSVTSKIKRSLIQLSFKKCDLKPEELVIEIERHQYTPEYIALVKDFYLKM